VDADLSWLQPQHWGHFGTERVGLKIVSFQQREPMFNQRQDSRHGQTLVRASVSAKIRAGQFEEGRRRSKPVLLQVNESARQLDQSFVKSAVGPAPVFEPKLFQHIVRLIKLPAIEAVKISLIKWIKPGGRFMPDHARKSFTLDAHGLKI